eukprot:TRINITY_DN19913_c0_g1_i1.p1 TRINITY_DN19913_c0_g1~~TRINITY_DN19913_c0_g1_i1.p1  ORF type:complete len:473 (+),score=93.94 TRINITY_DN19913_c0_g1_i1:344-1762(+)
MELAQLVATYGGRNVEKDGGFSAAAPRGPPASRGPPRGNFAPPQFAPPPARGGRGSFQPPASRGQSQRGRGRGRGSFAPPRGRGGRGRGRGGNFAPPTAVQPAYCNGGYQGYEQYPQQAQYAESYAEQGAYGQEGYYDEQAAPEEGEYYQGQGYADGSANGYANGYAEGYGAYPEQGGYGGQYWGWQEDGSMQAPSYYPYDAYGGYQNDGGYAFAAYGAPRKAKKKKDKSEKKAVERTGPATHFCDPCEKEFWNELEHANHVKMHVQCEHEGCEFTASKKVVVLHALTLHTDNERLKKLMQPLESPEEIAAYIAERKKAFPTKEAVAKKRTEMAASRSTRGGLRGVSRPAAAGASAASSGQSDENDDESSDSPPDEASSFDADAAAADAMPLEERVPMCNFFRRGCCKYGNRCRNSHQYQPRKRQKVEATPPAKKPTLLEKLLEKQEVKHDYGEILAAFRYIVDNNFFLGSS